MKKFSVAVLSCLMLGAVASRAAASPIVIFNAPDSTFQNSSNNPCIFFGPGLSGCAQDPAGWLAPVGPTGQGNNSIIGPLTQTYAGADFTEFKSVIGGEFILGLDINQTNASSPQSMTDLTVTFRDSSNGILTTFALPSPTPVPDNANGVGFADYLLGASCVTPASGGQCALFNAFVVPTLARSVTFTYTMNPANDGPDKLFLIGAGSNPACPDCTPTPTDGPPVPEPASLALLGSGLLFMGRAFKRRLL